MKFSVQVGEVKQHRIEYDFNQLLGRLVIKLNQRVIKQSVRLFNEPVRETHLVRVEEPERLAVRIEKERGRLVGSKCRVFLNGRLIKCYAGV